MFCKGSLWRDVKWTWEAEASIQLCFASHISQLKSSYHEENEKGRPFEMPQLGFCKQAEPLKDRLAKYEAPSRFGGLVLRL